VEVDEVRKLQLVKFGTFMRTIYNIVEPMWQRNLLLI